MKKPLKPIEANESGQIMPLALVGMAALLGMLLFALNVSRLMAQRERTRMLTDVTVMSGATVYARCLNFDAALKKINDITEFLDDALGWFPFGGEALVALDADVKAARSGFENAAPYLTAGCLEFIAIANHVPALPLWNIKDIFEAQTLAQGVIPCLNFDKSENNSDPSYSFGNPDGSEDHYSYRRHASGETVEVDNTQVSADAQGGAQGKSRDQKTGRFVKHDKNKSAKAEGQHSLTLISLDTSQSEIADNSIVKKLPQFYSVARARVSGGNFDLMSASSMEWGCFLAPVTAKDESMALNLPEIPMSGVSSIDKLSSEANAVMRRAKQWAARVPAILH